MSSRDRLNDKATDHTLLQISPMRRYGYYPAFDRDRFIITYFVGRLSVTSPIANSAQITLRIATAPNAQKVAGNSECRRVSVMKVATRSTRSAAVNILSNTPLT